MSPSKKNGPNRGWLLKPITGLAVLALSGYLVAPEFPGLWVVPSFLALIILLIYGPAAIKGDLGRLRERRPRKFLRALFPVALASSILLIAGSVRLLPILNPAAPPEAVLSEETKLVLSKLTSKVVIEAMVSRQTNLAPVSHLMGLYSNFSDKIAASVVQAEGRTQIDGGEIRLAESETVRISSDSFSQTVSPINQRTINASLRRLISPYRTVYNLMGQGTKSVSDPSSMGLSLWAKSLVESKIYLLDLHWPGPQLPPEAAAANALVLAGPRSPLGEEREKALIDYLKSGGRLFILHDPLVAALDSSMLESLGLSMPLGLVVDPDSAWAGTNDFFIVSRDFPAHPLTMGLKRPVVFPLAGAIFPVKGGTNTHEDKNEKEASQSNENTFSSRLSGHSWAVARTSDVAWLETDRSSIADNSFRYQKDQDILGPLTLASATSLTSGGRLIFTADADLAANGFIVFGGNLEFLNNSIFWLLEAQEDLATRSSGAWLDIDRFKARILFWVPTVFWPGLCLSLWLTFYYRRRRHVG